MLKRIWEHFSIAADHEEERRHVANRILNRLTVEGRMVLDAATLAAMRLGRKQAFEAVYDLVLNERAQMRSDSQGRIELLSNEEFARMMLIEVKVPEVLPGDAADETVAAGHDQDTLSYLPDEPLILDAAQPGPTLLRVLPEHTEQPDDAPLWDNGFSLPLPENRDLDWFRLDVAPALVENAETDAETRQTLPERKREAWVAAAEELVKIAE